jgi:chromate reductase, NAD(P)H dehydrogenase (quinone)
MTQPRILAFAGSARKASFNNQLVQIAAEGARTAGAEVTVLNLRDYPLPVFDQDLEEEHGTPENATRLKELFFNHDGLLISCPEYNSSITPLLKNTIDWVSRSAEGEIPLQAYRGKVAALMAASPGGLGGLRGLVHVRAILSNIGVIVLPDQVAVPKAYEAFDDNGKFKDEKQQTRVAGLGESVAQMLTKLVAM